MLFHIASLSHSDLLDQVTLEIEDLGSRSPEDQHKAHPLLDWGSRPVGGQVNSFKSIYGNEEEQWTMHLYSKRNQSLVKLKLQ